MIRFPALVFVLGLAASGPAFAAVSCEAVFASPREAIRADVRALLKERSLVSDPATLIERAIVSRLVRLVRAAGATGPKIRENVVASEGLLSVLSRLTGNGVLAAKDPAARWAERELTSRGLDELARAHGLATGGRASGAFRRLLGNRAVRFLLNPTVPPSVKDRAVPEPLLAAILRDGVEAHSLELRARFAAAGQNRVEAYRRFARGYRVVATAVMLSLAYAQYEAALDDINDEQKREFEKSLERLEDFLEALDHELEERGMYREPAPEEGAASP